MTLFVSLVAAVTSAQTPATAFTQPFDWTTSKIGILPSTNWGLFKADETFTISTSDNSSITVFDLYGRTVYSGAPRSLTLPTGHYFVQCNGDRNQFAVLPADYAGASFLGDMANNGWSAWAQRQRRVQPAWARTGAAKWDRVQAERNVMNWVEMDKVIENNSDRKIIVLASGGHLPKWVEPGNLTSEFADYVTALVRRYKGKIAAVEVWNEPHRGQFWGSVDWLQMLAELFVAARTAINEIDPDILVLGPSWSSPVMVSGTATLGEHGMSEHIDGLAWHDYWGFKFPPDQEATENDNVFPGVRGRARLHLEAARFDGPLFISEMGLYGQSALGIPYPLVDPGYTGGIITNAPGWSAGMARAMKYTVLYRAMGAELIYPHMVTLSGANIADGQNVLAGWEHGYRGPAPKTSAFLMSCYWLNDARLVDYRFLGERIVLSAWQRTNGTSVVFAWAVEGQSFALANKATLNMTDIYGGGIQPVTLGAQPVLFHSTTPNAAALLQSVMSALPPLNLAPVFALLGNQTVLKNQSLQFAVSATDPDNDPITYSASPLPAGATLDPATGVFSWTPTASQLGFYSIAFTATDSRGLSASTTTLVAVLGSNSDGLVGWWEFNETSGAVASDSKGSNPGALQGFSRTDSSAWVAGKVGNALDFDGIKDFVNLDSSKLSLSNNFTVASWIHPRGDAFGVFFCLRSIYAESGFRLAVRTNNDLLIQGQTTAGWHSTHFALEQIRDDAWNHVVVVYDKSTFVVYLDGVRVAPGHSATGNWGGDFVMNPNGFTRIGAEMTSVGTGFFDGMIDDVRIFNRTLSADEVIALYQGTQELVAPRPPTGLTVFGH